MKCSRPNCQGTAQPGRNRSLCHTHYDAAPLRGYVDSGPTRERIALLRSRGMTLRILETQYGVSRFGVSRINREPRVRALTQAKVFKIPVPEVLPTLAPVDSVGTVRRLQALVALGFTQAKIADELGIKQNAVSAIGYRSAVTSSTRAAVAELYDRWCMTRGPSELSRQRARAAGWHVPLAWDDIDDPDEVPAVVGRVVRAPIMERLAELEYLNIPRSRMPGLLGIQAESVERARSRHGLKEAV